MLNSILALSRPHDHKNILCSTMINKRSLFAYLAQHLVPLLDIPTSLFFPSHFYIPITNDKPALPSIQARDKQTAVTVSN